MNIEAKCKNCRFCKEMTGPHDTDNYYVCMQGMKSNGAVYEEYIS